MGRRVLVVGGTGAFGSRLVRGLVARSGFGVVIAARDGARAEAFARELRAAHPGRDVAALAMDAARVGPEALRATGAFLLVDAAGPWQGASYGLPRAGIAAGMHVLDLADARDYVAGFGPALDGAARDAGVVALTGASSTPALSNAVLDSLLAGWRGVDRVEVAISPGNRAPRGGSVVRAILSYAGRPVRVFEGGTWRDRPGWGMTVRREVPGIGRRWLSLCETPDLDVLPARFAPRRGAVFRAGLELTPLHLGLWAASLAVRARLLRSLVPFAGAARRIAAAFDGFGSDRGGMVVEAFGTDAEGRAARACWTLLAEAGDGPEVPTLPALAAIRAVAEGRVAAGARACVGVVPLPVIEAEFAAHRIACRIVLERPRPLFETALGGAVFARLPEPLRRLHAPGWFTASEGKAEVEGPAGPVAALVARLIGFPARAATVPVRVEMDADAAGERWTRRFGAHRFSSRLRPARAAGRVIERFGPLDFELELPADGAGLRLVVRRWWLLGLPLPRFLAPLSDAREFVDEAGRFRFDVEVRLPLGLGRVVRYRGWLVPCPDAQARASPSRSQRAR